MINDGPQPPIKQLATAVHRRPATSAWCGPLLLVLLSGVHVACVLCMLPGVYICGVCALANKHQTPEIY